MKSKIFILITVLLLNITVQGNDITKNKSELKEIESQINDLKKQIKRDEKNLKSEQNSLQKMEKDIASVSADLNKTEKKIKTARAKQTQIDNQVDAERLRIDTELAKLSDMVLSQHAMGNQGYIKLLLGQQDPASAERTLVYYKYLAQFTSTQVLDSREQVKQLMVLKQKQADQQQVLDQLMTEQRVAQQKLKDSRKQRRVAIASLDSQLTKSANKVGRLEQDQQRIKKLVKGLQQAALKREKERARLAAIARQKSAAKSKEKNTQIIIKPVIQRVSNDGLGKLQGRLKMPVSGAIRSAYGSAKAGSGIKWNGIMLAAPEGEPVTAIYDGQIVYADWFKGFGQLVIIDHGKGYMSLYSHNSQINRSLGEQIKSNDVIAYSGSTGGLSQPGLYFEVRYNGQPRDPMLWVKR